MHLFKLEGKKLYELRKRTHGWLVGSTPLSGQFLSPTETRNGKANAAATASLIGWGMVEIGSRVEWSISTCINITSNQIFCMNTSCQECCRRNVECSFLPHDDDDDDVFVNPRTRIWNRAVGRKPVGFGWWQQL